MATLIKSLKAKIKNALLSELRQKIDTLIMLQSASLARNNKQIVSNGGGGIDIQDFEFSAFSQNGEDGILDMLIEILELDTQNSPYPRAFIEFGVQDYTESNTRYLLKKRNFLGFVMDSNQAHIDFIQQDEIYWRYDIEAKRAFITKENINNLIKEWLNSRELHNIAILSIDIDGMDYFVWESIECVQPAIVVVEFNALFGTKHISVPYNDSFNRFEAHYSGLYFGASLPAFIDLGKRKGYKFIGADSSGTNAFFVHNSLESKTQHIHTNSPESYCMQHNARQSRDQNGRLTYLSGKERAKIFKELALYNTKDHK